MSETNLCLFCSSAENLEHHNNGITEYFVCSECHNKDYDTIFDTCLKSDSRNPYTLLQYFMDLPKTKMHGPKHHIFVAAAMATAYKNCGGDIDLADVLTTIISRGRNVPAMSCGKWGACGSAISSGIFISAITGAAPKTTKSWAQANLMTSNSLRKMSEIGGPRCCKRNSYIATGEAIDFVKEHFGIEIEQQDIACYHMEKNKECIKERCPYYKKQ